MMTGRNLPPRIAFGKCTGNPGSLGGSDRTPQPNQPGLHRHHDLSIRQGCPGLKDALRRQQIHWHDRQRSQMSPCNGGFKQSRVSQEKLDRVHAPIGFAHRCTYPGGSCHQRLAQIVQIMNEDRLEKKHRLRMFLKTIHADQWSIYKRASPRSRRTE